jgi:hypothetical protein
MGDQHPPDILCPPLLKFRPPCSARYFIEIPAWDLQSCSSIQLSKVKWPDALLAFARGSTIFRRPQLEFDLPSTYSAFDNNNNTRGVQARATNQI